MHARLISGSFILALVLFAAPALAQSVPHRASGNNSSFFPTADGSPAKYQGTGNGTHMGRFTFEGLITTLGDFYNPGVFLDPQEGLYVFFDGSFSGKQQDTVANGDKIMYNVSGNVRLYYDPVSGAIIGKWFPKFEVAPGSTGRFANLTGSSTGVVVNPPFDPTQPEWKFNWVLTGRLNLGKR